jgi:hypothetical protein
MMLATDEGEAGICISLRDTSDSVTRLTKGS